VYVVMSVSARVHNYGMIDIVVDIRQMGLLHGLNNSK
jgi:hypothetical protein